MKKYAIALAVAGSLAALAAPSEAAVIESFRDDCSVSVVIRRPYANNAVWDGSDILLARDWQGNLCNLLEPFGGNMTGVCQATQSQTTPFTPFIKYSTVKNPDGYFRWICGSTMERSRCPAGTQRVRFRLLGGDDEFQTQCDDTPMP